MAPHETFAPAQDLGREAWGEIFTLPRTIAKLKRVRHLQLYGSYLMRIPPEVGDMEALEQFTPYTSYGLHWFPYEITRCKRLMDGERMPSIRALSCVRSRLSASCARRTLLGKRPLRRLQP